MLRHSQPTLGLQARSRGRVIPRSAHSIPLAHSLGAWTLACWLAAVPARAQTIDQNVYVTNGTVYATAISGNAVYIGGAFSRVGPASGCGAPVNTSTGVLPGGFPKVNGYVNAVAGDGAGGWFIGGSFTSVGGQQRSGLAHVASDLSVAAWNPGANGPVYAIAVSGSAVYVGGSFQFVGGQVRNNIAALDAGTGAVIAWTPDASNTVTALAVGSSILYAGGAFDFIGGQSRLRLAALNIATGQATSWAPNPDGFVNALAVGSTTLYVGGDFLNIGGQSRSRLAELDLSTGDATSWNPSCDGSVLALALGTSVVYAGGGFLHVGADVRNGLAAVDRTTASATSWDPKADGLTRTIVVSGSLVYVGGQFQGFNGTGRHYLAALDATTALPTSWNPNPNDAVYGMATGGPYLYAGGYFTGFAGVVRNNLASFKISLGQVTTWDPNANGTVYSMAISGSTLYVGGSFLQVGSASRPYIAAVDLASGSPFSFKPNANAPVYSIVPSGTLIYVGGSFSNIGGQTRTSVARLKLGGTADTWNPVLDGLVDAVAVNGSSVYVGGSFTTVNGSTRNHIAEIDATTGTPTAWNPNADSFVYALAVSGSNVYAGGNFTNIGSQPRNHLAALDISTGVSSSWNPNPDSDVNSILVRSTVLYAGGTFYFIGGLPRHGLAAIEAAGPGTVTGWTADLNQGNVYSLAATDSVVYAGGGFIGLGTTAQSNVAGINTIPEVLTVYLPIGGNGGSSSVTLTGKGFRGSSAAKLVKAGSLDVPGTQTTVSSDGTSLSTIFDLTGVATGVWHAVVINPDLMTSVQTLENIFLVQSEAAPQLEVSIVGPDSIRANYPTAFDLVVENPGNVDAVGVPLWVTGIPAGVSVAPDFALTPPPQDGGEPDWSAVPAAFQVASGQYLPVLIPRVPPGTLRRRFILNAPSSVPTLQMGAAVSPSWLGAPGFVGCLASGGVVANTSCATGMLSSLASYLAAHPGLEAISGTGLWAKEAWECEGTPDLNTSITHSKQVLDFLEAAVEQGIVPAGCGDPLLAQWRSSQTLHVVFSIDPNDKLAPVGTVSSLQAIPYSIRFENLAGASAATRQVTVVDPLPTSLDLNTLSLEAVDLFGTVHLLPPPGSKQFTHDVDLGHDNLIVRVSASLDVPNRVLAWVFTTLDKNTLQPPSNPLLGFLPPNQTPPQGEGSVLFTIRPAASTPNGSTIQNGAVINFDGSAQNTPVVANLLDTNAPASNVLALNNPIPNQTFPVSWTATGSPTDLKDFTVYVAEDNGPYQPWKLNTVSTGDTYVPRPGGHTYAFYSVARDVNGNIETAPASPDAQTLSTTAVGDQYPQALALAGARPNPARGVMKVAFTLPSSERATLDLIDIAGRRVARREVGEMGPGSHELALESSLRLRAGLYFLRLSQGKEVLKTRVVLMR